MLHFAASCPGGSPKATALAEEIGRRAPGLLDAAVRRAGAPAASVSLRDVQASLELACLTTGSIAASSRAAVPPVLATITGRDDAIGVVDGTGRFLPDETLALVVACRMVAGECDDPR